MTELAVAPGRHSRPRSVFGGAIAVGALIAVLGLAGAARLVLLATRHLGLARLMTVIGRRRSGWRAEIAQDPC